MTDGSIQQQHTIGAQQTDWSTTLGFNQFDPSVGLLQNINVGLVGDVAAWVQLQNLDLNPAAFSVAFPGLISVLGPDNTVLTSVAPDPTASGTLAANAGTILAGLSDTASTQATLATGAVGDTGFVGTGTVTLPVTATASLHATGGANLDLLSHASAGASVALDYNYNTGSSGSDQQSGGGGSISGGFTIAVPFIGSLTPAQTSSFADQTTGWSDQVAIQRFDPNLGQLVGIKIDLTNDIQASVGAENLGPDAAPFSSAQTATATLGLGGLAPGFTSQATASAAMSLGAFDGTVDYAGSSGQLNQGITQTASSEVVLTDPAQLAAFLGTGSLVLPISVTGSATLDGPGNLAAQLRAEGGATVSVSYEYFPGYSGSPSIAGTGPASYATGQPATQLAPGLTIADAYDSTLSLAKVSISGGATGDLLAADTTRTGITASYDPASETLLLTGQASLATYQQVLRSVTFASTSPDPSLGGTDTSRSLSWYVIDGLGSVSAPIGSSIAVAPQPAQWSAAASGDWSTGADWSSAPQAPGAGQDVAITQAGTYTIDVSNAQTVRSLLIDAPGAVLRLDAPLQVLSGLTLEAGTLVFNGGSLSAGSVTIDGGTIAGSSVAISTTGSVALDGGALANATTISASEIVSQTAAGWASLQPGSAPIVTPSAGESGGIVDAPSDTIVQVLPATTDSAMQFLSMMDVGDWGGVVTTSATYPVQPSPNPWDQSGSIFSAPTFLTASSSLDAVTGTQSGSSGSSGPYTPPLFHPAPGDAVSMNAP